MIPFGLGIIIGGFAIVKMIEQLFKRYKTKTYFAIIGFLIASIVSVAVSLFKYNADIVQIIIGVVLLIAGAYLTLKLEKND